MIHYEMLPNGVRFVSDVSVSYVKGSELLQLAGIVRDASFEYCKSKGVKLDSEAIGKPDDGNQDAGSEAGRQPHI